MDDDMTVPVNDDKYHKKCFFQMKLHLINFSLICYGTENIMHHEFQIKIHILRKQLRIKD